MKINKCTTNAYDYYESKIYCTSSFLSTFSLHSSTNLSTNFFLHLQLL